MPALVYIIVIGILSWGACILIAALISEPTLVIDFARAMWSLLGTSDSPFFWMLTAPALIMIALFILYVAFLAVTAKRSP